MLRFIKKSHLVFKLQVAKKIELSGDELDQHLKKKEAEKALLVPDLKM